MNTWNKMLNWLGITENDEDEEMMEEVEEREEREEKPRENVRERQERETASAGVRRGRTVPVSGGAPAKVHVIYFQNFDQAKDAADEIKMRRPVIANLEKLDNDTTRRVVDFLSGLIYGLDGEIQNVSNRVFLVTPSNVEVTGNAHGDIRNGFSFSK